MLPTRLLQATCLVLLSAAVLGDVLNEGEIHASIAAVQPMAALPAEVRVAATKCVNTLGAANCAWGPACSGQIANCQLCQGSGATVQCSYCRAGFFRNGTARCDSCYTGFYCSGAAHPESCDDGAGPGFTTPPFAPNGRWSAKQCTGCLPGWGWKDNTCQPCLAGTFSTRISYHDPCSYCPDGMWSNNVYGATDCVNVPAGVTCPTGMIAIANLRSCGCPVGTAAKLTTNDIFTLPFLPPLAAGGANRDNIWYGLRANQTFDTYVRMPRTNTFADFPVQSGRSVPVGVADDFCTTCTGNTASSLNAPLTPGAQACKLCPATVSRPNRAGEGVNPNNGNPIPLPARATCVCADNYEPDGDNSANCRDAGLLCPTTNGNGCKPVGTAPTPPGPALPPVPAPAPGSSPRPQEWSKWNKKDMKKMQRGDKHKHHDDDDEDEEEEEEWERDGRRN